MAFIASFAAVSAIFSSIVIYGAGVGLSNAKTLTQGLIIVIATGAFLTQRALIVMRVEGVPTINCFSAHDGSFACLSILRLTVLFALYIRVKGVIKDRIYFHIATYLSVMSGVASVVLLNYQGLATPYLPGKCVQNFSSVFTAIINALLVGPYCILNLIMALPIIYTLNHAPRDSVSTSRIVNQTRLLVKFLQLIPLLLCMSLVLIIVAAPPSSNLFGFLVSLLFTEFCQIWLLLFPLVVLAADNLATTSDEHLLLG
ncbi:hypothetical protein BDV3_002407 [Batrachochytrium dendrobatidis]|nr:hypothetical protein QVD99_005708 [Batrachochytrium dendrobatidis]OAJ44385.1 hypothetical protein, variant [Batrachochytrium dendrobatidis JEL423]